VENNLTSSSDCCLANQNELQKNQFLTEIGIARKRRLEKLFLGLKLVSGAKVYDEDCRNQLFMNKDRKACRWFNQKYPGRKNKRC